MGKRGARGTGLLIVLVLVASALPAAAEGAECTNTWAGPSEGEWQTAENWSAEHVPTSTEVACIPKGNTVKVTAGANHAEMLQGEGKLAIVAGSLALHGGKESSHIFSLQLTGGALKGSGELLVPKSFTGDGGSIEGEVFVDVGAEASGFVEALEPEGPGLRVAQKSSLIVKGALAIAGGGGRLNAIEGAFLGVSNAGSLTVGGPEGRLSVLESADLVNAAQLTVNGPKGRLSLSQSASLLNSKAVSLKAPEGGIVAQESATIENTGDLTIETTAGEVRLEGTSIDNSGALTVEAPEGRIHGDKGAALNNSGTLTINGEGVGNGLVAGETGTTPLLVNTGTVLKDEGEETTIVEFKVDNEKTVESKLGALAFTAGGNSGQEEQDLWIAEEFASIVFSEGTFTLGKSAAFSGLVQLQNGATVKAHQIEGEEANVWIAEGSLELNGAGENTTFENISSAGTIDLVDEGVLTVIDGAFIEAGTFDVGDDASVGIADFFQEEGATNIGGGSSLTTETLFVLGGTLNVAGATKTSAESFFQLGGQTVIGEGAGLMTSGIFIEEGSLNMGAGGEATLGDVFQEAGTVSFGAGGSVTADDMFLDAGSFEMAGNVETSFDQVFQGGGTVTLESGSSLTGQEAYLDAGLITGSGAMTVGVLWWGTSTLSGSGTTFVTKGGLIESGEEAFATLEQRRLVNNGAIGFEESTLMMADGARLINNGKFDASSEATGFGAQIRVAEESSSNPRIVNANEFSKESGGGTTEITVPFENNGRIRELSGTLRITNPIGVLYSEKFGYRCYCGDPIEPANGNFFENQTDIAVDGLGVGLVLTRSYSAQAAAEATKPGPFGYGWTSSFTDHLRFEEGEGEAADRITVVRADGSTMPFTEDGKGGFDAPSWSQDELSGNPEAGYTMVLTSGSVYGFSAVGKLQSVTDRNGNEVALAYDEAGRLETIEDPSERQITLAYNKAGFVESAEDPMGHLVKYAYEGEELASVTLPGEESPRWQFDYDAFHRMTTMTDGRGGETINEYDGEDRVVSQVDPAERTTTLEYDGFHTRFENEATESVTDMWFNSYDEPTTITRGYGSPFATTRSLFYDDAGHLVAEADANGHVTTYGYNPAGDRTKMVDPNENETKWSYNEAHDLLSTTLPSGQTTTIARDANGNPETISRPAPGEATQVTSFEYSPNGLLKGITDPLKRTWSYEYNAQGDRISETNPAGETGTWKYDKNSQLIEVVTPRGNEEGAEPAEYMTMIDRDPQGRPFEVIDPLGNVTKYEYDANGNLEAETDGNGHTTKYTYSPANEPIEVEKPNGDVLKTGYDGAGLMISQTDGNEQTTTYVRNVLGQPIEVVDPLSRKTLYEYDPAGNLEAMIDPLERTTFYAYDPVNRLEEVIYSDGETPTASFEYDIDGNLLSMVDGTGESTYEYDQLGRLTEAKNGNGDTVEYEYNLADEQTEVTYPNGKSIVRTFDAAGRLEGITDWLEGITTFGYDADSNLESIDFPAESGNVDEFTYDATGRMETAEFLQGKEVLASIAYARDKVGQVEGMASSGLPGAKELAYEYDENDRLIKAGEDIFKYDAADNLIKSPTSTFTYDKASQLETGTGVTYSYNAVGERIKETPTSSPATTYKYDQAGNLLSVTRPEEGEVIGISEAFSYDGTGLLTSRTFGESSLDLTWDISRDLPLILSDEEYSYVYGPGGMPITQISFKEVPSYLHHDHLGSVRAVTDPAGKVVSSFSYRPYGQLEASSGPASTSKGFAGQYTVPGSGLQYLRARMYDPRTGQFLSRDPIEAVTRQPYSYAQSSPTNNTDPTGLEAEAELPCIWPTCPPPAPVVEPVEEVASSLENVWNSIFGNEEVAELELTRAQEAYEEENHECPTEEGKQLRREGEEILGRKHSDAKKEIWNKWWKEKSKTQKKRYDNEKGPRPSKRNRR
jgi:RHS repeat-associated protein